MHWLSLTLPPVRYSLAWTPNLFTYIGKWIKQPWGKEKTVQELVIYRWATQYDVRLRFAVCAPRRLALLLLS